MRRKHTTLLRGAVTVAVAGLLAAGCSSSKSGSGGASSTSTSTSPSTTATSSPAPPGTGSSSAATGGQPSDPTAATAAVTKAYTTFFDSSVDQASKATLVQNPQKIAPLVQALAGATQGKKSSISVTSVTFTSPTTATVNFAILLDTATVLPSASGQAVLDPASGQWQVADQTLCSLGLVDSVPASVLSAAGCS